MRKKTPSQFWYSSAQKSHLPEEERRGSEETRSLYAEVIQVKYNVLFTLRELRNALDKCKNSAPVKMKSVIAC